MLDQEFKLQTSKCYLALTAFFCVMSVAILLGMSIPILLKLTALILLMVYSVHLFSQAYAITALRCHSDGTWYVQKRDQWLQASVRKDTTMTPWVSVVRWEINQRRWPLSCVVFRDALGRDEYRRFIVQLKFIYPPAAADHPRLTPQR